MRFPLVIGGLSFFLFQARCVIALVRDCYQNTTLGKTQDGCYGSLRDIAVAMEEKDPFQSETYVLCPNKEYMIGSRDPDQPQCYRDGDAMLELRQFSTVQCGESGSSSNNCTIVGGFNQMATTAGSYNVEPKNRIKVSGITFAQGRGGALFLAAGGDISFKDCIFKDHMNDGTIKIVFQSFGGDGDERRNLQPVDSDAVSVVFDQCVFESNRYPGGVPYGLRQLGLINMRSSEGTLNVTNSVFRNNEFQTDLAFDTYLIKVEPGNVLNMENNCFLANALKGRGLVHLDALSSVGLIERNAGIGQESSLTDCDFLHVDDESGSTCIGFDLDTCGLYDNDFPNTLETGDGCSNVASDCSTSSTAPLSLFCLLLLAVLHGAMLV